MSDAARPAVPSWAPASVRSARRTGSATDEDLLSGRALDALAGAVRRAADLIRSGRVPADDVAAGHRHLLVLLALGIDEALREADPYDPHLVPGNVDAVLKWGMDCPDAAYLGAPLRGDAVYRVSGTRGTVRYLGFQVMAGMGSAANVVADDLTAPDGSLELWLGGEERDGSWMPLPRGWSALVVRQFFYDWETEEPARLRIERVSGGTPRDQAPRDQAPLAPAEVARQIVALGDFVEGSLGFWLDIEEAGRAQGLNRFREPAARTDLGGAAENVTVWGSWDLGDDEALVIDVAPPEALYWSVSLGNLWWESIDYASHQSSLNGHQAVIDPDGVFRAVVSHRDPGVANWLDTAGHRRGPMIARWVRAAAAPVPEARVVPLESLDTALPPGTARVSPAQRWAAIARRRAGVRRRFCR